MVSNLHTWDHPDQVLMVKSLAHELCHNTQTTNLDLDIPVVNVILHSSDEDSAALDHNADCTIIAHLHILSRLSTKILK